MHSFAIFLIKKVIAKKYTEAKIVKSINLLFPICLLFLALPATAGNDSIVSNECLNCDLTSADLGGTTLKGTKHGEVNLDKINRVQIFGTSTKGTNFRRDQNLQRLLRTRECPGCDLRGIVLRKDTISGYPLGNNYRWLPSFTDSYGRTELEGLREPIVVNLRGANLEGASLIGVDLAFADLREANLALAHIEETSLYKADLRGADLRDSTIKNSVLTCANLQKARNFNGFKRSDFTKAVYFSLDFVAGERITGFNRSMACMSKLPDGTLYTDDCGNLTPNQELNNLLKCFGES